MSGKVLIILVNIKVVIKTRIKKKLFVAKPFKTFIEETFDKK
jgi:hypothetical protein